jgi:hypothetical protein
MALHGENDQNVPVSGGQLSVSGVDGYSLAKLRGKL